MVNQKNLIIYEIWTIGDAYFEKAKNLDGDIITVELKNYKPLPKTTINGEQVFVYKYM